FVNRVNADLANNFGNLVSRVLAMQKRYFDGAVQPMGSGDRPEDRELREAFRTAAANVDRHMEEMGFHRALESIIEAVDKTNQYIVQTAPFTLVKDPDQKARVGEILHHVLESVRLTGDLLAPFLPETGVAVRRLLGLPASDTLDAEWGGSFPEGHQVQPPEILFPRIEETEEDGGSD
ncbi:MAG: methionine--tRNA ligase, partial [Deltaproteobacteria bacterium]|nr:methionine--tRNA ligase [Deltaproteobacteria bacterium]